MSNFGHRSHTAGVRRSKKSIQGSVDRWDRELKDWFLKYKHG